MRSRDVLGLFVVIAVVAAAIFVGWQLFADTVNDDEDTAADAEPGDDPQATASAYLSAWESGDVAAMRQLVRQAPEDFDDRHRQLTAALSPTSMSIDADAVDIPVDGRAVTTATITLDVDGIPDPVTWETELELLRERGQWGVEWTLSTIHPELRPTWQFATVSRSVEREPILAADGTPLAGGGAVTFGFQPALVESESDVIDAFADAIPGAETTAEQELSRGDLNDDWFYPIVTVSEAVAEQAGPRLREATGVLQQDGDGARALLDHGFAQHVVGVIAEATAEQLEALGEDTPVGTEVPQYGLEAVLNDQLEGSDLVQVGLAEATGAAGNGADEAAGNDNGDGDSNGDSDGDNEDTAAPSELRVVIAEGQQDPSEPVRTTIDIAVQRAVEETFAELDDDLDEPAAIVVVEGDSGAIAASGSRPLGGFNRALAGRYAPGSTFKAVTAEALLATGMTPDDEVECPGELSVGGLTVPNAGDLALGTTTFGEAFADSCNTTFASLGADLGADALVEAAERFGFGVAPDVPLEVFGGSFPVPEDAAEMGAAAFGQGRVEASPLQMASVAAAITSGTWHQPYLIDPDAEDQDIAPREQRALSPATTETLQDLMQTAVTAGTGSAAAVDGETVGGKTGTAQATGDVEHAWFIGTWQDYGFAVLVEDGGAGGEIAAPIGGLLVENLAEQLAAAEAADDDDADDGQGSEDGDENGDNDDANDDDAEGEDDADGDDQDADGDDQDANGDDQDANGDGQDADSPDNNEDD